MLKILLTLFLVSCGVEESSASLAEAPAVQEVTFDATRAGTRLKEMPLYFARYSSAALVALGTRTIAERGHTFTASMYEESFGQVLKGLDLGDHEPWSEWLVSFYADLERILGKEMCELLHLDDIKVLNYAVPVAYSPSRWDQEEYSLHFVPLAGVYAYWANYVACTAATYSAGAWFMVCTPIGILAERVMTNRIAPGLSDRVWTRANIDRP